jgi:Ig-like domain-containing protein
MWHDRTRLVLFAILLLALAFTVVLSVRGFDKPAAISTPPSIDVGQIQTRAVLNFADGLTSTALALPTATATDTPEAASAVVATSSTASTASISPTPSCYRLKFQQDISIPDNTLMTPAQVFTKTWQVQNTGICTWKPGFKLVLIGGLAMGGSPFTLDAAVNPGSKIQISIKMVAPTNQTGIVQGTWRMTDDNGNPFGDALTCVIVVPNTTGAAPTPAATTTP